LSRPLPAAAPKPKKSPVPVPKRTLLIFFLALVVIILGGLAVLATIDIPAPKTRIERTIPNDRLPR
jgi:hypothetical protein